MNYEVKEQLYEGKAKKVYATNDPDLVIVSYKDDATALDGLKKGTIAGKGVINNKMSNYLCRLLEKHGVPTHFVEELNDRETVVKKVSIVPLEVIIRNISAGSFAKRYGVEEGIVFAEPTIEFSYKNDDLHDPLINSYHALALGLATKKEIEEIKAMAFKVNDILKEYAARGTYIFPPRPSMRLITNIFEYCSKYVPKWNTISISGYHIREAGSTASQEIAFTIADGIAYVEAAIKAGLDVDAFAGRLSFFWNAHNNVLEEVAKFRASRRIWAKVMKERFHAKKDKSMKLRFHTQTAGSMLTAQQPNNNIIRVALQTAAAVMGGTQSLHTNSRDEALALPTQESVTIALRTQQIVAYESGLADVIDPLAGSYYVEAMTNRIEKEAWDYIKKIDEIGGAVSAIEKGYIQKEIQDSAYKWQMDVESGARTIVGVNKFQMEEKPVEGLLKVDASVGEKQKAKVEAMKAKRDNAAVEAALADLEAACKDENENLMPHILAAVKTYATLGEICGVMRKVFGEYEAHVNL